MTSNENQSDRPGKQLLLLVCKPIVVRSIGLLRSASLLCELYVFSVWQKTDKEGILSHTSSSSFGAYEA